MFRGKRKLEVKMVKDETPEEASEIRSEQVLWGANASVLVDNIVVGGVILIGSYFLADTVRSVAIHTAVTKITPTIVVEAAKK